MIVYNYKYWVIVKTISYLIFVFKNKCKNIYSQSLRSYHLLIQKFLNEQKAKKTVIVVYANPKINIRWNRNLKNH